MGDDFYSLKCTGYSQSLYLERKRKIEGCVRGGQREEEKEREAFKAALFLVEWSEVQSSTVQAGLTAPGEAVVLPPST